jgi:hypothetical protein
VADDGCVDVSLRRKREVTMSHTLAHAYGLHRSRTGSDRRTRSAAVARTSYRDDALGAMRGVIGGTLLSVLVFWLPLAFLLM